MQLKTLLNKSIKVAASTVVTLILVSFLLHALQVSHGHFGINQKHQDSHAGNSEEDLQWVEFFGEYLHPAEKKLFDSVSSAPLLPMSTVALLYGTWVVYVLLISLLLLVLLKWREHTLLVYCNFLCFLYYQGILNPKIY
jgi:hypothetical protein